MRYVAPQRGEVDPQVFDRPPLASWHAHAALLRSPDWPAVDALNALWPADARTRFAEQDRGLLADGLHYEQRIAETGRIATRAGNWHDLFNALVWLRHPRLKRALNAQQVDELARMGSRQRSRPQCAMTLFDESGCVVLLRDPALLALWDAHDWHGLFWRRREAWLDGSADVAVFGHALLEHALTPGKLLVGKALPFVSADGDMRRALDACAGAIAAGRLLRDPQELRPLPLSGMPGWHPGNDSEAFHRMAACYQPRRPGRCYPPPLRLD
ncbi:hypothetical protein ASG87_17130 [Frateuria sp. Soil773]|uniref:DUF3025 domain-containing protein n=1 Tax=Frateuria sp. Soil773 TaxID=1736407 RepID=UPI0006F4EF2D|nr:DUF3025 domain-containing protein [Frateuria sp. Soil773]KRE95002.1 hypothetical protein ASG87_17130 [Frateuria sp. Soil773]